MPNEFSYKIFKYGDGILLAVSDLSLIGKSFKENDLQIEISEDFYYGKECNQSIVLELIRGATIVNAVGNRIINLLVKERVIDKDSVLTIKGVPHAQIIKIEG